MRWRTLLTRGGEPYALDFATGQRWGGWWCSPTIGCSATPPCWAPGNARFLTALLAERGTRVQFAGDLAGIVVPELR